MKSILKTLSYSGSREIQRVQVVRWDSWDDLFFLHPEYSEEAFVNLGTFYKNVFAKKYGNLFGKSILFHLPDVLESEVPMQDPEYGLMVNRLTAASVAVRK